MNLPQRRHLAATHWHKKLLQGSLWKALFSPSLRSLLHRSPRHRILLPRILLRSRPRRDHLRSPAASYPSPSCRLSSPRRHRTGPQGRIAGPRAPLRDRRHDRCRPSDPSDRIAGPATDPPCAADLLSGGRARQTGLARRPDCGAVDGSHLRQGLSRCEDAGQGPAAQEHPDLAGRGPTRGSPGGAGADGALVAEQAVRGGTDPDASEDRRLVGRRGSLGRTRFPAERAAGVATRPVPSAPLPSRPPAAGRECARSAPVAPAAPAVARRAFGRFARRSLSTRAAARPAPASRNCPRPATRARASRRRGPRAPPRSRPGCARSGQTRCSPRRGSFASRGTRCATRNSACAAPA
mmetsp:Transcript_18603/g.46435  ORF Transcript_18603/g.46435 Transcript_18603/m.46435 type:complete len:352 (-) Transcript_18603:1191-2246(-)